MRLVIDIPEWKYKSICEGIEASKRCGVVGMDPTIHRAIYNGTPLPKCHGRLVDISKIDEDRMEQDNPIIYLTIDGQYIEAISLDYLNDLPAIIEAEEGGEK